MGREDPGAGSEQDSAVTASEGEGEITRGTLSANSGLGKKEVTVVHDRERRRRARGTGPPERMAGDERAPHTPGDREGARADISTAGTKDSADTTGKGR